MSTLFSRVKVTTICMPTYLNRYNLLNARTNEDVAENCVLFSIVNYFLRVIGGKPVGDNEFNSIKNYIELLWSEDRKRFDNIPGVSTGNDRYISKDQYMAICAFSHYHNLDYHKRFWSGINLRTYDNLTGKFNLHRWIALQDYTILGLYNGKRGFSLLKPWFYATTAFSFWYDKKTRPTLWEWLKSGFKLPRTTMFKTDGQILSFVRIMGMGNKLSKLDRLFWKMMMKFCDNRYPKGFQSILTHYYEMTHPNSMLAREITNYVI